MLETTFIYALNDPETGECRYVGKADNPHERLFGRKGHLKTCRKFTHYCANWIKSLTASGLVPHLEILQEVPRTDWRLWERAWIKASREIGMDLVNGTDGGEGLAGGAKHPFFGKKHSPEARAKIGLARQGEKHPFFGKKHSPEACAKISAAKKGKKHSPEACAKISASLQGNTRARRPQKPH